MAPCQFQKPIISYDWGKRFQPLLKKVPLFPSSHPLKIEVLLRSNFWKFGRRFNPPSRIWACTLCHDCAYRNFCDFRSSNKTSASALQNSPTAVLKGYALKFQISSSLIITIHSIFTIIELLWGNCEKNISRFSC